MIIIALYYGLRRSEILGLRWQSINFEKNTFTIEHTVVRHKTTVYKDSTKTKDSKATYQMLPELRKVLLEVKEQQEVNKVKFGKKYIESDYCFTKKNGKLITPDSLYKSFVKILENNNLPHMRLHDLRHSCASILHEKGWSPKDIQEWLRHARIETTMNIYTHISEERRTLLTKDLEDMF